VGAFERLARSVTGFLARFDAIFTLNQDQLLKHHYRPELLVSAMTPRIVEGRTA
jgi:hypothetical protein